jgi:uncharacterized membrane protein (UPF0182 family)
LKINIPFKRKPREYDYDSEEKANKGRKWLALIIILVLVIIAAIAGLAGFLTDWLWFKDLGYNAVFWKKILTQIEIGVPVFIVVTLLARVYLNSLKKRYFDKIESHEIPDTVRLNKISWGLAVVFGLLAAIYASTGTWLNFLKFTKSTDFGLKDPLFGLDVSFYVFKLAFLTQVNNIVLAIIIGIVVVTLLYYGILVTVRTPDIFEREDPVQDDPSEDDNPFGEDDFGKNIDARKFFKRRADRTDPRGKRKYDLNNSNLQNLMEIASGKLVVLGVIFYLMLAIDFFLKQFDLLHAHTGTVYGAGFTDVNITLWIYRIVILLAVVGAVTFGVHMKKSEFRKLLRIPAAMIIVGLIGGVLGMAVQSLLVSPDEINKETKYLENNIEFTRHAYGLDNITVQEFPANVNLTAADIANNSQTITNIRINDYTPVNDFYNQTQSIRQYYDFNDVDVDRYTINGAETQTFLSAREINEEKISTTWLNMHLKYTHGYGITLSRVNTVTASGQPDVLIKNIPPESSIPEISITQPEIYFGELSNQYVIVNADEQEFDYPDGNENKYTKYKGTGGIEMTFFNKLLFAIREHSMKLLVSSNVNPDSRIIINRNVVKRINEIMPYLSYEEDPYMVTVDGKLYWILDAYTTSAYYPYSEPYSGEVGSENYIRNSIKVVVDAYNGDTNFYVIDNDDPIAKTYMKIYPTLFKDIKDMPDGIKAHLRYPNALFNIQAQVYTKYHMDEVKVFYQNEDLWDIANQIYGTKETKMEPTYYIFRLPGEDEAEFINMVPFTPKSKQNMTSIMMARNDGENYGKLLVYKFPKNKTIYGPMQIEAQIDQNTEISKEFSLWNSTGSTYRRGNLFVIPIEDSLMYVEPVYLEASNQAIPEVKRVIVAYDDKIAYAPTLSGALEELFGGEAGVDDGQAPGGSQGSGSSGALTQAELIQKANEAYDNAVAAQKEGNWKAYGDYINELAGYLDQLENAA